MQSRTVLNIPALSGILLMLAGCAAAPLTATGPVDQIPLKGGVTLVYQGPLSEQGPLSPQWFRADVNGRAIYVFGEAVRPSIQSAFLLEHTPLRDGDVVLDLGTGSGVQALFAAWSGRAQHIVATDIGKDAVKSAQFNVQHYGLLQRIDVREGDLFAPLKDDERFSLIINNIDYPAENEPADHPLWRVHERFFAEVGEHLLPGGRIVYQSGHFGNIDRIRRMVEQNGFLIMSMRMERNMFFEKDLIIYYIERNPFAASGR